MDDTPFLAMTGDLHHHHDERHDGWVTDGTEHLKIPCAYPLPDCYGPPCVEDDYDEAAQKDALEL